MGILSDILEDNKERAGQILAATVLAGSERTPAVAAFRRSSCPLCPSWFHEEKDLQSHILRSHGRLQAYLKVDQQVIQDLCYVEHPLDRLVLVILGDQAGAVKLALHDKLVYEGKVAASTPVELGRFVPKGFEGLIRVEVRFGSGIATREYLIYSRMQPPIDAEPLDDAVVQLQRPLLEEHEPNWTAFQKEFLNHPNTNPLVRRYFSAFYEYVLGSYLELKGDSRAGTHFERAYGHSRPFATSMAHTARCLLGLKMNWFHLLDECGPRSVFYDAKVFFGAESKPIRRRIGGRQHLDLDNTVGLWVDPFTELLLKTIDWICSDDLATADIFVARLERFAQTMSRNNEDKLWVLKGRLRLAQGLPAQAQESFRHLEHHPIFGKEAERHL